MDVEEAAKIGRSIMEHAREVRNRERKDHPPMFFAHHGGRLAIVPLVVFFADPDPNRGKDMAAHAIRALIRRLNPDAVFMLSEAWEGPETMSEEEKDQMLAGVPFATVFGQDRLREVLFLTVETKADLRRYVCDVLPDGTVSEAREDERFRGDVIVHHSRFAGLFNQPELARGDG